ncbi:sodium:solute symporter family protein [Gemmatimonas sp.]|jgi:SSS family solute:Na+ symporter|uniref:sodium:solute symporter family protein n=1 Tax=Gemmatimonas sp. TaxID=1962908 RepID=UPI0037BF4F00
MTKLTTLDYVVMATYFVVVLGIGWALRRMMRTSTDFFLSGRSLPPWVTGLAFLSANLGAQEVIGMGASGAKYGIATSHFYWIGAIPAMVFVGIFMMPFYYGSKARSVPEYLKLRFDEKTRTFNALGFAAMTIFSSGISMYAMGKLLNLLLGWDFNTSVLVSAVIVLAYVTLGGLTSAIYNEVLQFFMIVFGFAPLVWVGLKQVGGWDGMTSKLSAAAVQRGLPEYAYTNVWQGMGSATTNSIGIEWFGMVMGLGFVLSFGYWCTDFLVVQRAMAADSMTAARRTPLIAAVPKMFFPFLVIVPGMIALAMGDNIIPAKLTAAGTPLLDTNGHVVLDYDLATPMMLVKLFPTGMLGLGLTALIASFMSGMAGNVTAFNTVWTYDIYQAHIKKQGTDEHYLWMGRAATVGGIALSVAAAYVAGSFNNIMELLQLVFAFVNAPLFATFALGMFWKRSTGHGAFWGLVAGTVAPAIHHGISLANGATPGVKGGFFGVILRYPSEMAQTFWTAVAAFTTCFVVTIVVSLATRARREAELEGLVYSLTPRQVDDVKAWYEKPSVFAVAVMLAMVALNVMFY